MEVVRDARGRWRRFFGLRMGKVMNELCQFALQKSVLDPGLSSINFAGTLVYSLGVGAFYVAKDGGCPNLVSSGYNNEVRIYFNPNLLVAGAQYYGGANFGVGACGWCAGPTHTSNDIYYVNSSTTTRVNIYNGTWRSDYNSYNPWHC